ncbi:hypothetical protein LTR27_008212 [Elasticomyces elasticus]|nr:hypothetical protein LTR27_008212 [Elasticomyces elasticus]
MAPGASLLLTCRQVYLEARGLCKEAYPYTRYWSETQFILHSRDSKKFKRYMRHMTGPKETTTVHFTARDLSKIQHLRFMVRARDLLAYDPRVGTVETCSARMLDLHSLDAVLSLKRHSNGRDWWCVEVDGIALGPKDSRLAVYVSPGNDVATPRNPIRGGYCTVLFYDETRSHWWNDNGKARFDEVTVGEIEELMGVRVGVVGGLVGEAVPSVGTGNINPSPSEIQCIKQRRSAIRANHEDIAIPYNKGSAFGTELDTGR